MVLTLAIHSASSSIVTELTDVSTLGHDTASTAGAGAAAHPDATVASTSAGTCAVSSHDRKRKEIPPEARYWTWGSTQASTASLVCCPLLAVFGIWYSVRAYKLYKTGEYYKSWKMKKLAWSFTIASLVVGILMWLTIISVFWSY